jgi:regulator of protease activity HflC (stomatin/prohibitin superfamily)
MAETESIVASEAGPGTIARYQHGWRSGKPVEDPEKLKRWGLVGAKPSEYLVCTRGGVVDRKRSGQGRRIFKWPWESIAIVPTTLQRIEFTADQITREHVGVSVTGIAVYRIAEPVLAAHVLNFTYVEAASEKLGATLREMFVGAARRLIANLALDECLTRRKETIAGYLMEEIAPVVGGHGAAADTTNRGWGVVLDTIEIQQVTVQSQQVFADLQAPFRAAIAGRAELADLDRKRAVAERRAVTAREIRALEAQAEAEATEVEAREAARRAEIAANATRQVTELERDKALHQIRIAEEQRRAKATADAAAVEAERVRLEALHRQSVLQLEHERALANERQAHDTELARLRSELAIELRTREADAREHENQLDAGHQRRLAELERELAQVRARQALVAGLPQIALALRQQVGELNVTQIGPGDGAPGVLNAVPAAIAQLLALAKSFGIDPAGEN